MMQTTRVTRSSVLGKRAQRPTDGSTLSTTACEQLQTPESTPNPKRIRTSLTLQDGDFNKENVPPFNLDPLETSPSITRPPRSLRRHATESLPRSRQVSPSIDTRKLSRRASASEIGVPSTPVAEVSQMFISTPPPTPPTLLLPFHSRVRALLRPTCNGPDIQFAGRGTERAAIHAFLFKFIENSDSKNGTHPTTMFISGSPGSGKTALVNAIIHDLNATSYDVKIVTLNCMALNNIDVLWERLIDELSETTETKKRPAAGKLKKCKGKVALDLLISSLTSKCILILDELDHITSNPQALDSLFSLSSIASSSLRIVGIANTHTLTTSYNSSASSKHIQTLHFAPYTPSQLSEILQSRLSVLRVDDIPTSEMGNLLPLPTVTLLTKKIAALTGDVRSLFEVLRGAIDLAVATASPINDNPLDQPPPKVTPTHILAALKAYAPCSSSSKISQPSVSAVSTNASSEIVNKVRHQSFQAQLVLLSIVLAYKRTESGLSLLSSPSNCSSTPSITTPKKKRPSSPVKRASSSTLPSPSSSQTSTAFDSSQMHTFYSTILTRGDSSVFQPASRSEFNDLVNMLEGTGLLSLSSSPSTGSWPSPSKAKRTLGRSTSFGGATKGQQQAGAGIGEIKLGSGVWGDEILRALGVNTPAGEDSHSTAKPDVREEETRDIWNRECARIARELRVLERARDKAARGSAGEDAFDGAFEE